MAWVVIVVVAKGLKLEKYGFEIKAYSLTYKNRQVQSALTRMLGRTKRGIRVFADVSVVAGFLMMGFAFWFLLSNISNFFVEPTEFAELTVLIPGVTLTSSSSIVNFLLSIPIVLVIHEGAHGIVATLEKIKIKTDLSLEPKILSPRVCGVGKETRLTRNDLQVWGKEYLRVP